MASPGFSPPTLAVVASGAPATAAEANLWTEYLQWLASTNKTDSRPYCALSSSGTQALTAATFVTVTFDTEVADVGNGHSGTSGTYTIPTTGLWQLSAVATFASTATTNLLAARISCSSYAKAPVAVEGAGSNIGPVSYSLTALAVLTAGDTVTLQQFSTAASNTDITNTVPALFCYWLNS